MRTIYALLLCASLFIGCDDADQDDRVLKRTCGNEEFAYFPLGVGNTWEYEPVGGFGGLASQVITIPSTKTINDHEYFVMVRTYNFSDDREPISSKSYYRVDEYGYVYYRTDDADGETNRFRLAAADGEKWKITKGPMEDFVVVRGTGLDAVPLWETTVENCISFYFDEPKFIDDEHSVDLAPGLGIVRTYGGEAPTMALVKAKISGQEYTF